MLEILFAGDYCPQYGLQEKIDLEEYQEVFGDIKPHIESVDYSIVNFETCIPGINDKPIDKCGPNLKTNDKALEALRYIGFDCVSLANNHIRDFGDGGVMGVIDYCKRKRIDFVGAGRDLISAKKTLTKEINGKKIAFVNFCENEFSIATKFQAGAAPLDPVSNYYQIVKAKTESDFVVVIIHGGHEHLQLPSQRMKSTYQYFVDIGADAIVNHHQHCYSGYEIYKGKPIFYGLGNFCFDDNIQDDLWNYGFMLKMRFSEEISFELIPYEQCKSKDGVKLIDNRSAFDNKIKELNEIINNTDLLEEKLNDYLYKGGKNILGVFEPYTNRYIKALYNRRLLPSFIGKKKSVIIRNFIECESHRDKLLNYLRNI